MTIIDGYIAIFIFAMSIVIMTCDPKYMTNRYIERVCATAMCVMGIIIVIALLWLMTL
jgi:hypothetical protein